MTKPPTTPLMKQFLQVKEGHKDAILFFRVGDFYEMFYEDAVIASKILQITLTSRNKNKKDAVPLCGLPYHAASGYIARLIRAGKSVAVCEQMEEATAAKGIVRREVVRVITPGTVIEPELLSSKENNFLAALKWDFGPSIEKAKRIGLACLDLSTGEFRLLAADARWQTIEAELIKLAPKEILLPSTYKGREERIASLREGWTIRFISPSFFIEDEAETVLLEHFKVHSVAAFGGGPFSLHAAGTLLAHLQDTQKIALGNIVTLRPIPSSGLMRIHPLALRHLDLIPFSREQQGGTLYHLLDQTVTAMGGRLLKEWLLRPLLSPKAIQARQAGVAFFYDHIGLRSTLRETLKQISDIERLIGRITLGAAQPRDLIGLKESVALLPEIEKSLRPPSESTAALSSPRQTSNLMTELLKTWENLETVYCLIEDAIVEDPPPTMKEGGIIKPGYLKELDELRRFQKEGRSMLTEIELKERRRTGIESLKVRYNHIFGYYIEVNATHLNKVPEDYIRKQTLTRVERFMTPELASLEEKLTGNKEAMMALEARAFDEIRAELAQEAARIQEMAGKIATIDLLSTLAEVAHQNNYCRPTVNNDLKIEIIEGRHPVLEAGMGIGTGVRGGATWAGRSTAFIPNDVLIDPPGERLLILTGPNMAGKSTYMRQVALIVLMAQMGGYVPAKEATIGVVDQIFTRVGAQDALTAGMSTFMVEMTEMSQILRHATGKSLILLDEIGRGTSTFDGISIAWAIAEYVHSNLGARTLFATHYHELTGLALNHEGIRNYHVLVREWGDDIVFLRKMVEGGADKSYGIQVGRLAGLPPGIIKRAKEVLKVLEEKAIGSPLHTHFGGRLEEEVLEEEQPGLFSQPPQVKVKEHPAIETLRKIDPLNLTPMEALQVLVDLSEQIKPRS